MQINYCSNEDDVREWTSLEHHLTLTYVQSLIGYRFDPTSHSQGCDLREWLHSMSSNFAPYFSMLKNLSIQGLPTREMSD